MSKLMHKVFVYGTLKTGEPNNHWFSINSDGDYKLLGKANTVEKFPLIIGTKYNIPFLLYSPGKGHKVQGELYEVDDLVLANLDILEMYPKVYIREQRDVIGESGEIHSPWIYFIKEFNDDLLGQEMFENYSANGPHGLKYMRREERDRPLTLKDLN